MPSKRTTLTYPRKRLARLTLRVLGRLLLPLFFRIEITGRERFPDAGPLLVVGNHTAAMEAVLLNIYSPWQIEMLSAADTPAERIIDLITDWYGVIPLHRGSYDRAALAAGLDVLSQRGVLGLFPEGGIWQPGKKKALPGIAWLSYRSGAPVLPIGFSDTSGSLHSAFRFRRPRLSMHVGALIEPARLPAGASRKAYLQSYADQVMESVHRLVPREQYQTEPEIINERFDLRVSVYDQDGKAVSPPGDLVLQDPLPVAKFLHRPAILKIFRVNLNKPVDALEQLDQKPALGGLIQACQEILAYLRDENPYLLTYRFGVKEGLAMEGGLKDLLRLLQWCQEQGHRIEIQPIRRYDSLKEGREVTQIKQGHFEDWM